MLQHSRDQPQRIDLAAAPPFPLGGWLVEPGLRQISRAGQSRTLEPRVMQVLVALAQAQGGIVGRDALVDACWNGRIVGENAINRVISLLRALGANTGAFEIETITKVGYRLKAAAPLPAPPTGSEDRPSVRSFPRRAAIGGLGAAIVGGGAYLIWPDALSPRLREAERQYRAGIDSERLGDSGVAQALAHYRAAVRADPAYAPAWGALARALLSSGDGSDEGAEGLARQVEQASNRALRLDPRNADALLAQVMIAPSYRNWTSLDRLARRALAVHPDLTLAQTKLGLSLADTGRYRDGVAQMEKALARQPLLPGMQARFAWLLWQTGRTADAARTFDRAYRIWPGHQFVWSFRSMYLGFSGQIQEAIRMTESDAAREVRSGPFPPAVAALCARAVAAGAGGAERAKAVDAILAARRTGDIASFVAVTYLAALGEVDAAFEQTYDYLLGKRDPLTGERQPPPPHADRSTDFLFAAQTAAMRADPRFPKLTAAIGLDEYWRSSRSRPDYRAS